MAAKGGALMKRITLSYAIVVLGLLLLAALSSCGDGGGSGGNGGGGGQQPTTPTAPTTPTTSAFNGTFSGNSTTTQSGLESVDNINLSMTVGSPLNGTFFRKSDGTVGTISGDAVGNTATFTGTSTGICPASFSGTMTLMDDNTVSMNMTGDNCDGQFSATSELVRIGCIDLKGTWHVSETANVACTIGRESITEPVSGAGTVSIEQNGCNVRYVLSLAGVADVPREGEIEEKAISFSGRFVIPLVGEASFTQNIITFAGPIINEKNFTVDGSGIATGTVAGSAFSCTGDSKAEFSRCYDVAVALLRGGPFPPFDIDDSSDIAGIKDQVTNVDPQHVIEHDFRAFPGQLLRVRQWLDEINRGCARPAKVILVGYSLGGNAVRQADFSNMCARITIDPINPDLTPTFLDQHDLTLPSVMAAGRIINRVSTSASFLGLRGYHIAGADDKEEPNTNHRSILSRVRENGLVSAQVRECLTGDNEANPSIFAGTYSGTFAGDDSGTFTVVVDPAGHITGSGVSREDGPFDIAGTVNSQGAVELVAGTATTGATFAGTISAAGEMSGTWENRFFGERGTFTGRRQ
jgi:hypothetical protein